MNSTSQSTLNFSDDSSSPYYLHPSNNLSALLIFEIFVGDNYTVWSRSITVALTVKNKVAFIDGSITAPPPDQYLFHTA